MLSWFLALAVSESAAVECVAPIAIPVLEADMAEAEAAYADLDEARFRDRVNELAGILLPCVSEALPTPVAARYHRLMALHLSVIGDQEGALAAARSARARDPEYVFPDALATPEHPVRKEFEAAPLELDTRKVPEPKSGALAFDGVVGRLRPTGSPAVVQLLDDSGIARQTAWLGPRAELPAYVAIPRKRNTLIATSAGFTALSLGLYAGAWAAHGDLLDLVADPDTGVARIKAKRGQVNALTALSGVSLGVSVGFGAGAAFVGQR